MEKKGLLKTIENAFDGVPQPDEITLHVAEAHDSYDYSNNAEHKKKDFIGPWQNVPEEHIQLCQSALSYVDATGLRYYLPAYMAWYIKNLGTDKVWSDHTLYTLDNYPHNNELAFHQKGRFSNFSKEQLRACALFMKYCAGDTSGYGDPNFAQLKYERHWQKYV